MLRRGEEVKIESGDAKDPDLLAERSDLRVCSVSWLTYIDLLQGSCGVPARGGIRDESRSHMDTTTAGHDSCVVAERSSTFYRLKLPREQGTKVAA